MTYLNDLPVIITSPGDYATRGGGRATVHRVAPQAAGTTSFGAKGRLWRMYRGKVRPRAYTIWHISGRAFPHAESRDDIIGPWIEEG